MQLFVQQVVNGLAVSARKPAFGDRSGLVAESRRSEPPRWVASDHYAQVNGGTERSVG